MRVTSASTLTSASMARAPISLPAARTFAPSRPQIATCAPRCLSCRAVSNPMPELPPVTRTFAASIFMVRSYGCMTYTIRRIVVGLLLLIALGADARQRPYRIIGYVRPRADFTRVSAEKLTHVNYAFAQVSPEGELYFPREESGTRLIELRKVLKQRNPSIKLLVSVGGWGGDGFSDAALTDASRKKFADSVAAFINRYGLDGIDLDWEYPGQPGPGI